jgi:hypothetical protein
MLPRPHTEERERGWNFDNSTLNESTLKPLCQQIEKHFQLPPRRLYRYFAATDDPYLPNLMGQHYRGFHIPRSGMYDLPDYLWGCFFRPVDEFELRNSFEEMVAFDNLIYIRQSTCLDAVGCATTYAHELQHFMQHGHSPTLWSVNSALYNHLREFDVTATAVDVLVERDANIVSKRVSEAVCGANAVEKFANEQIQLMELLGDAAQVTRWRYFRDVPSSTSYDLLEATLPFVEKYKRLIDFGTDIEKPAWWKEPHGGTLSCRLGRSATTSI